MWKDSETEIDYLDFDYFIELLKDIIGNDKLLPASIGVYGDWGSGKSSLIRMAINSFSESEETKDKKTVCLNFNSWLFEDYDDAKTSLLASVLDSIKENRKLTASAEKVLDSLYKSIDKVKLLKGAAKFGADLAISGGLITISRLLLQPFEDTDKTNSSIEKFKTILDNELNHNELREDIKKFRKEFDKLLNETKIEKLIIFIDELDRCNPETILETLEAIRLFLFTGKTVFIIGADERQISNAIKNKYNEVKGIGIDIGKEYLEKLIQYPIKLPPLNSIEVEIYITCLLMQNELSKADFDKVIEYIKEEKRKNFLEFDFKYTEELGLIVGSEVSDKVKESISLSKQISEILAKGLNGNPRQCKRFLNTLVMREKMAQFKGIKLNRKILAKLMLLEYFRPQNYEKVYENVNEKKDYFKEIENDKETDFSDDEWMQNWLKILPKLSDEKLYAYFYFSRESLNKNIASNVLQISQDGKVVLENLIGGSELKSAEGIKDFKKLSEFDKQNIVKAIYQKLMVDTEIKNEDFNSFIKIAIEDVGIQPTVVNYLESIPISKMKISLAPLIGELKDKLNDKSPLEKIIAGFPKRIIEAINGGD